MFSVDVSGEVGLMKTLEISPAHLKVTVVAPGADTVTSKVLFNSGFHEDDVSSSSQPREVLALNFSSRADDASVVGGASL